MIVALDTLHQRDVCYIDLGGIAPFMVLGGPDQPARLGPDNVPQVPTVRLSDGACFLLNHDTTVTVQAGVKVTV